MDSFEREERELIEREYAKHMEQIEKCEMRERHFELKEAGYLLARDALGDSAEIVSVFLGYIEAMEMSRERVCLAIADGLAGSSPVMDSIRRILAMKIREEHRVLEELAQCSL